MGELEDWQNTANRFALAGDYRSMRAAAHEALTLAPQNATAQAMVAEASLFLGERAKAMVALEKAEQNNAEPCLRVSLVRAYLAAMRFALEEEIPTLLAIVQQTADDAHQGYYERYRALGMLADAYLLAGEPEKAMHALLQLSDLVQDREEAASLYSKALFCSNYRRRPQAEALRLACGYQSFFTNSPSLHVPPPSRNKRKFRIGYLSPDFRWHAVAHFLTPFLRDFDGRTFDVFCYALNEKTDAVTHYFQKFPVHWRNLAQTSPSTAAKRIANDHVDILIDLAGHTEGTGLALLARHLAPVQMSAIGYVATTGLDAVRYFLSDTTCNPAPRDFTERVLKLPHSHLCYCPDFKTIPAVTKELPALRKGYVTFASFNNFAKVSGEVLSLWREILTLAPTAHLILKAKTLSIAAGRALAEEKLKKAGLPLDRIELRPFSPDYLEQYADVDLALDTFPYNGGLTTCEALYMGVPVVTLRGQTHGARFGASILSNLDLPEFVVDNEADYVGRALYFSHALQRLQEIRSTLRARMEASPLMDAKGYMRDVEALYRKLIATPVLP